MHTLVKAVVEGRCRLLVKPHLKAPFCTSTLKTISGIAGFYASEYTSSTNVISGIEQQVTILNLFRNMHGTVHSF